VPKDSRREVRFNLRNPTQHVIKVTTIRTSCDCFVIDVENAVVPAPGQRSATARLDLTGVNFTGRLELTATRSVVLLSVKKAASVIGMSPSFIYAR
jgi:hypothetical protein